MHMGGVDLADMLIALYRSQMKSRRDSECQSSSQKAYPIETKRRVLRGIDRDAVIEASMVQSRLFSPTGLVEIETEAT
ncbi:unnamed protein product [Parnassius apollo]|uniref:(apollo) hypothetical protein n=1 Tax=Parnassius apollo TaxID=110799 RepID=A0A8S3XKW3_PARAO|nr:unnamed protein product [Parnassius apollo]